MKIAVSSDWHGMKPKDDARKAIENCDLLLLAGDVFEPSYHNEKLCNYFKTLIKNGKRVVITPGNHDFGIFYGNNLGQLARYPTCQTFSKEWLKNELGVDCLIDEDIYVEGIRIYGFPWTPMFCDWAFNADENSELIEKTKKIPYSVDILISHGPPLDEEGNIDSCCPRLYDGQPDHLGSKCLTEEIIKKSPRLMFCGHIHSASHKPVVIGNTICRNVSYLNEAYQPAYDIFTMTI